jgi:hypothetical protein
VPGNGKPRQISAPANLSVSVEVRDRVTYGLRIAGAVSLEFRTLVGPGAHGRSPHIYPCSSLAFYGKAKDS